MIPSTPDALPLRDIHLPGPPGFWPPAPGWWLVAAVAAGLLLAVIGFAWRQLKIRRRRKQILDMLDQLEHASGDIGTPEFLARLSRLLRRLALTHFPRRQVAALTGGAWLRFLDESGGDGRFSRGPGRALEDGPYRRELADNVDTQALVDLIRDWIRINSGA